MISEGLGVVYTSGVVVVPMLGGVVLGNIATSPPTDLVGWIIGPAGVLVLLLVISWYLWKHAKDKQTEIDKLRDKIESDQDERIKELERKLNNKD